MRSLNEFMIHVLVHSISDFDAVEININNSCKKKWQWREAKTRRKKNWALLTRKVHASKTILENVHFAVKVETFDSFVLAIERNNCSFRNKKSNRWIAIIYTCIKASEITEEQPRAQPMDWKAKIDGMKNTKRHKHTKCSQTRTTTSSSSLSSQQEISSDANNNDCDCRIKWKYGKWPYERTKKKITHIRSVHCTESNLHEHYTRNKEEEKKNDKTRAKTQNKTKTEKRSHNLVNEVEKNG